MIHAHQVKRQHHAYPVWVRWLLLVTRELLVNSRDYQVKFFVKSWESKKAKNEPASDSNKKWKFGGGEIKLQKTGEANVTARSVARKRESGCALNVCFARSVATTCAADGWRRCDTSWRRTQHSSNVVRFLIVESLISISGHGDKHANSRR